MWHLHSESLSFLAPSASIILSVGASSVGAAVAIVFFAAVVPKPVAVVVLAASAGAITAAATNGTVSIGKGVTTGFLVAVVLGIVFGIAVAFSPLGGFNDAVTLYLGVAFLSDGPYKIILFPVINAIVFYALPIIITTHFVKGRARQASAPAQQSALVGVKGGIIAGSAGLVINITGYFTLGLASLIAPLIIIPSAIIIALISVRRLRGSNTPVENATEGEQHSVC